MIQEQLPLSGLLDHGLDDAEITTSLSQVRDKIKLAAETHWLQGQSRGQRNLIHYLYLIMTKELGPQALNIGDDIPEQLKEELLSIVDWLIQKPKDGYNVQASNEAREV